MNATQAGKAKLPESPERKVLIRSDACINSKKLYLFCLERSLPRKVEWGCVLTCLLPLGERQPLVTDHQLPLCDLAGSAFLAGWWGLVQRVISSGGGQCVPCWLTRNCIDRAGRQSDVIGGYSLIKAAQASGKSDCWCCRWPCKAVGEKSTRSGIDKPAQEKLLLLGLG